MASHFSPGGNRRLRRPREVIRRLPVLGPALVRVKARVDRWRFPGSGDFWEQHYARGGMSGPGSYGQLAEFKAEVLNAFVRKQAVSSVVEFGCGDGNQLTLTEYPAYIGLDISPTAIEVCRKKFAGDSSKRFVHYNPTQFSAADGIRGDIAISLDVLYHLVEDAVFDRYLTHLFGAASRFVVIYSSNEDIPSAIPFVRHRQFSPRITQQFPEWELWRVVENPHRWMGDADTGSHADFYFFRRIASTD